MKLYVRLGYSYDYTTIYGIYSSKEKALEAQEKNKPSYLPDYENWTIEEYEIDTFYESGGKEV